LLAVGGTITLKLFVREFAPVSVATTATVFVPAVSGTSAAKFVAPVIQAACPPTVTRPGSFIVP